MAKLTDTQRAFLRDNAFYAVLTTLRPDGSPHSTVVWIDEADGDVVFNTARDRAKDRHMVADPRASIVVLDPNNPYRWLSVSGPVSLTTEGGSEGIEALSHKYRGTPYDWAGGPETRVAARLHPEHVTAFGL